jgi:glyoxylase-like metal-dependent hydrolase (beta-lactamase superfamily II)
MPPPRATPAEPAPAVAVREPVPGVFWCHPPDGGEAYIICTGEGLVLIDTGLPRHKEAVYDAVCAAGLEPREIRLGIITHCHCDHVGAMGWWREKLRFPVLAHELAVEPVESGDPVVTGACIPYAGFDEPFIPCPVDRRVHGGEVLTMGDRELRIIKAPGHTVGSIHIHTGNLLFVGDNLFATGGIGWMDVHWGSNPADYVETLERMRPLCGNLALPGHGEPFELTENRINTAREAAAFYIPGGHGLGSPRAPSQYTTTRTPSSCT